MGLKVIFKNRGFNFFFLIIIIISIIIILQIKFFFNLYKSLFLNENKSKYLLNKIVKIYSFLVKVSKNNFYAQIEIL